MADIRISSLEDDLRRLQISEGQTKPEPTLNQGGENLLSQNPNLNISSEAQRKDSSPEKRTGASSISSQVQEAGPAVPIPRPITFVPKFTLASICNGLKNGDFKNVVVMCGAGVSVAAGIPDFRTPGTGLYDNLQKYNLPTPQAVFTLDFFRTNPNPFFNLAKELYPGKIKPTHCHYFIQLLSQKGILRRCFTQNIDGLERLAGLHSDLIMEAHGGFSESHCIDCHKAAVSEDVKRKIFADEIPRCVCGGLVKPDIVFFGESLPQRFSSLVYSDFPRCDLLIVMGTSLAVSPFCDLVDFVAPHVPRILVNRDLAGNFLQGRQLERDVAVLGDCQESIKSIVEKCGWTKDLKIN